MQVLLSHVVPDVPPAEVARWWSDFQDGRVDHPFVPGSQRRVVQRGPGHVSMEEETRILGVRVFRETATAWPGDTEVRFAGTNDFATFEGRYVFEPEREGTRIVLHATVRLRRPLAWTERLAKPIVQGILRADLRGHAKELRRDLGKR